MIDEIKITNHKYKQPPEKSGVMSYGDLKNRPDSLAGDA